MRIPVEEFKNYVTSMRGCKIGSSYALEPRHGSLTFDFSDMPEHASCTFDFKRDSGNGKVVVRCGSNTIEENVFSKVSHKIKIDISGSKTVKIFRPFSGSGFVSVHGLTVSVGDEDMEESQAPNWKQILSKAAEQHSIRIVGDRALASEGSMIRAQFIHEIRTEPPNMYKLEEDDTVVNFLGPCEIISLVVDETERPAVDFPHFEQEPQVLLSEGDHAEHHGEFVAQHLVRPRKRINKQGIAKPRLIFDTAKSGFNTSFSNKYATVIDNKCVKLEGKRGEYSVPLRLLNPGSEYILTVEARNLSRSGNSKYTAQIVPNNDDRPHFFFANTKKPSTAVIVTPYNLTEEPYRLVIGRHASSTGDIVVNRIILFESPREVFPTQVGDTLPALKVEAPLFMLNKSRSAGSGDNVLAMMKQCARYDKLSFSANSKYTDVAHISSSTVSGARWLSKIKPYFSGFVWSDDFSKADLSVCKLGQINGRKTILLSEFSEQELTEDDVKRLGLCKRIVTLSQMNADVIERYLPNHEVAVGKKMWPMPEPQPIPAVKHTASNSILYFHRGNADVTDLVLRAIADKPVVMIGARGHFGDNVTPINEYLPYQQLIWLMSNARCIVDVPLVSNYTSGIIELALRMGTPLVSHNWSIIDRQWAVHITANEHCGEVIVPSIKSLSNGILEAMALSRVKQFELPYKEYNGNFHESVQELLG